jgi:hypothetical protein
MLFDVAQREKEMYSSRTRLNTDGGTSIRRITHEYPHCTFDSCR